MKLTGDMLDERNIIRVPNSNKNFKVVFLGDKGTGKSSIIERICSKEHVSCHLECNVEIGSKELEINGALHNIEFFNMIDNPGNDISTYKRISTPFFKDTSLVIIVIDLSQPDYFSSISKWIFDVENHHHLFEQGYKILCLGTKADKKHKQYFLHQSETLGLQISSISEKFKQNILYYEVTSKDCNSCAKLLEQIKFYANKKLNQENEL